jgi:hypothetical protein
MHWVIVGCGFQSVKSDITGVFVEKVFSGQVIKCAGKPWESGNRDSLPAWMPIAARTECRALPPAGWRRYIGNCGMWFSKRKK